MASIRAEAPGRASGSPVRVRAVWQTLDADIVDLAAPDVAMYGGLGELRRIAAFRGAYGVPLVPHDLGSPVATVAGAHLGASIPNVYSLEFRGGDVPWWESLVERTGESGPVVGEGPLVPEGPGLGIEFTDEAREHVAEGWEYTLSADTIPELTATRRARGGRYSYPPVFERPCVHRCRLPSFRWTG